MTGEPVNPLSPTQRALLRALARQGAHITEVDGEWRLMRIVNGCIVPAARLLEGDVQACRAQGLIAQADRCWRLTSVGRTALRRALATPSRKPRNTTNQTAAKAAARAEQDDVLAWLRRHKGRDGEPLIGAPEFDAGERLRADFHHALMAQRVTSSWSPTTVSRRERMATPGGGVEMIDRVAAARQRFRRALAAVGPDHAEPLVEACCHHIGVTEIERRRGWPQRSGKLMLQAALKALATHYGLRPPDDRGWLRRIEIRHWGADNFRPTIE